MLKGKLVRGPEQLASAALAVIFGLTSVIVYAGQPDTRACFHAALMLVRRAAAKTASIMHRRLSACGDTGDGEDGTTHRRHH